MSSESVPPSSPGRGRRSLLRALTGGGALAALALTPSGPAAADTAPAGAAGSGPDAATGADPFASDAFRAGGRVREFWLQADSFEHNAVPNGRDAMTGATFTAAQTTFQAVGYRAYTPQWGKPLPGDLSPEGIGPNTGIPGPVLRAEVGDVIRVHFRNNDSHYRWPHSLHPHGVRYTPDNDGAWMADLPDKDGTAVPYGGTYTYTWTCVPGSVGSWPYHDHAAPQIPLKPSDPAPATTPPAADSAPAAPSPSVSPSVSASSVSPSATEGGQGQGGGSMDMGDNVETADAVRAFGGGGGPVMEIGAELGLFGMIAVTDARTPKVDREFVLFFHDVSAADAPPLGQDLSLCNGGAFVDNAPTFTARSGDRVRWRVATLGNSFHTFHIHGHRWRTAAGWTDTEMLGPATTLTVEYREDNPGDWLYHCHVAAHMMHGMAGRYRVTS
ncbi:multicopper oxidase domain-containing protein [Actinacidiphila yeochonensis]|uniref:multicopper oxidase domain-containing protein n=1 Tax=Actinacidiphila yeochonensis TaxID=89050 RepID=UPI00068F0F9F|nr:multicopper oxidase domain-containing protein [Actinacidiphila yeochonensis]